MKKTIYLFLLVIEITAFIYLINNNNLYVSNETTIFTVLLNYIILTGFVWFIINNIINIIQIIKKDIIYSIITSNDIMLDEILTCIRLNKDYINLHSTNIGNNIIHTIITDSKLHHDKLVILLNNNLIETHTIHEVLKELFMLENDTNKLLHFDVDNNQQDLFCKQVIEDSINNTKIKDIIIEDDKVIIPKEKNSRTNTRRKKQ